MAKSLFVARRVVERPARKRSLQCPVGDSPETGVIECIDVADTHLQPAEHTVATIELRVGAGRRRVVGNERW